MPSYLPRSVNKLRKISDKSNPGFPQVIIITMQCDGRVKATAPRMVDNYMEFGELSAKYIANVVSALRPTIKRTATSRGENVTVTARIKVGIQDGEVCSIRVVDKLVRVIPTEASLGCVNLVEVDSDLPFCYSGVALIRYDGKLRIVSEVKMTSKAADAVRANPKHVFEGGNLLNPLNGSALSNLEFYRFKEAAIFNKRAWEIAPAATK